MKGLLGSRKKADPKPENCVARFIVTKIAWKGRIRRILCVSPKEIATMDPDFNITNRWSICPTDEPDIDGIQLGQAVAPLVDEGEIIISARADKKSKFQPLKFYSKHRSQLLTALFQCIAAAGSLSTNATALKILGSPDSFVGHLRQSDGVWSSVTLRLTCYSIECQDFETGEAVWRCDYASLTAPAFSLLGPVSCSTGAAGSTGTNPEGQAFAVHSRLQRLPQLLCCRQRDALLACAVAQSAKRLGLSLIVDPSLSSTPPEQLLGAVTAAARSQAALPGESPISEWHCSRLQQRHEVGPALLLLDTTQQGRAAPSQPAVAATVAAPNILQALGVAPGANLKPRRLCIMPSSLVEWSASLPSEVLELRQLSEVASLVRFTEDPRLLGVEWMDAALPPAQYVTMERDALLAALLVAVQAISGRPVPILTGLTAPGDHLLGTAGMVTSKPVTSTAPTGSVRIVCPVVQADPEVQRMYLEQLQLRAKAAHAELAANRTATPSDADLAPLKQSLHSAALSDLPLSPSTRVSEAVEHLVDLVFEFNACMPYSGPCSAVLPRYALDGQALGALLGLLPHQLQPGVVCNHLTTDETKLGVAVLQCLQRLVVSHGMAEALMQVPGALGRLFAAYSCGSDAVVCEAAKLLLRLWAPAAARAGAAPWKLSPSHHQDDAALAALPSHYEPTHEDLVLSKSAKSLCFSFFGMEARCSQLLAPLARLAGGSASATMPASSPPSALTSAAALELVASVACEPWSTLTDGKLLALLLQECSALGRPLFSLFHHPAQPLVPDGAALLMAAIAGAGAEAAGPLREAALAEGAVLTHLHRAMFAAGPQAKLSQQLIACWCDEHPAALALLKRIFPAGLIRYLNTPRQGTQASAAPAPLPATPPVAPTLPTLPAGQTPSQAPPQQQQQQQQQGTQAAQAQQQSVGSEPAPVGAIPPTASTVEPTATAPGSAPTLPEPSEGPSSAGAAPSTSPAPPSAAPSAATTVALNRGGLRGNWPAFWAACFRDHRHAGLIWNQSTRMELREALEKEEVVLRAGRQQAGTSSNPGSTSSSFHASQAVATAPPCWNHQEFFVQYPSLSSHLCVGGVFVTLLGDGDAVSKVPNPREIFTLLHQLYLSDGDWELHQHHQHHQQRSAQEPGAPRPGTAGPSAASASATQDQGMQELCIKAMTTLYSVHAGVIGPFDGMPHLLRVLDLTWRRPIRHRLLQLLHALLLPDALQQGSPQAQRVARLNAYALMGSAQSPLSVTAGSGPSGAELLVDLMATAHEEKSADAVSAGSGRSGAAAGTGGAPLLLTASAHEEPPREWYWYPGPSASVATATEEGGAAAVTTDQQGRAGPLTKDEVRYLFNHGKVDACTLIWADGMAQPLALGQIRELRWWVAQGPSRLVRCVVPRMAQQLLLQLVRLQPAIDSATGGLLLPAPRVHRLLSTPRCLPHICQVLLTQDAELVDGAARLLQQILAPTTPGATAAASAAGPNTLQHQHAGSAPPPSTSAPPASLSTAPAGTSAPAVGQALPAQSTYTPPALSRLYLTGALYFALAYTGSNLEELSGLLRVAHLKQAFRGAPQAADAGHPLCQRSYLGHVLPESLLYILETYGPRAFATTLAGDSSTPEVIWSHAMRNKQLLPQLQQHLGDFPARLSQRWSLTWDYAPLPPVTYHELSGEMFCHRYYLRNLCDEARFPLWPIQDHVQMLQALLTAWRLEIGRQPLALSEADACQVLGLTAGPSGTIPEEDIRRAYRNLARKWHPDKNPSPEALPTFRKIQQAYERLQEGAQGAQGPQMWRLLLIVRCQIILYRRYPDLLKPFKFAGYPLLLGGLQQADSTGPTGPNPLSKEAMPLTQACVELCWLTCVASQRNADELLRSGGLATLAALLGRLAPPDPAQHHPPHQQENGHPPPSGPPTTTEPQAGAVTAVAAHHPPASGAPVSGRDAPGASRLSLGERVRQEEEEEEQAVWEASPLRDPAAVAVLTGVLRCMAAIASIGPDARQQMAASHPGMVVQVTRCCSLGRRPQCLAAVEAALLALSLMAASQQLQQLLLGPAAALCHVVPLLFSYDPTLPPEATASFLLPFSAPKPKATPPPSAPSGDSAPSTTGLPPPPQAMPSPATSTAADSSAPTPRTSAPGASPSSLGPAGATSQPTGTSSVGTFPGGPGRPQELGEVLFQVLNTSLDQPMRSTQVARTYHALLAAQCLARLAGCLPAPFTTPANPLALACLSALLTAPLAQRLRHPDPTPLLALLAGALESATAVWSSAMRDELLNLLRQTLKSGSCDPVQLSTWSHTQLAGELQLGGVFVRIFNLNPSPLPPDTEGFCKALVTFLHQHLIEHPPPGGLLSLIQSPHTPPPPPSLEGTAPAPADVHASPALEPAHALVTQLVQVLRSLLLLLDAEPPLMGLLSSPSAIAPIAACLHPAALLSADPQGTTTTTATIPSAAALSAADSLATAALQLLLHMSVHAGCQAALVQEAATLRRLYWLVYRPTSRRCLEDALKLLRAASGQTQVAAVAACQGGALYLLSTLLAAGGTLPLPALQGAELAGLQVQTALLLGRLASAPGHGAVVALLLKALFPPGVAAVLLEGDGEAAVACLSKDAETPEVVWNERMRSALAKKVGDLASAARRQQALGQLEVQLPGAADAPAADTGEPETLFCGGIYVRQYLKDPGWPLKDPRRFVEGLLERFTSEMQQHAATATASGAGGADAQDAGARQAVPPAMQLVASAAVEVLKAHPALCNHAVKLGYGQQLLSKLQACLASHTPAAPGPGPADGPAAPSPLGAASGVGLLLLQLLHQLSYSQLATEGLSTLSGPEIVSVLLSCLSKWQGSASVLVLECLKRLLVVNNRNRDLVVRQALSEGLLQQLLQFLDWRQQQNADADQQDLAVLKVLAVEVVTALAEPGLYATQVEQVLEASEVWQAYKNQRHDLFLPAGASTTGTSMAGLLKGPETVRFALPAPPGQEAALPDGEKPSQ